MPASNPLYASAEPPIIEALSAAGESGLAPQDLVAAVRSRDETIPDYAVRGEMWGLIRDGVVYAPQKPSGRVAIRAAETAPAPEGGIGGQA